MSKIKEKSYGAYTTGPLPLLIHAALRHSSWSVRQRLWKSLNLWLENCHPKYSVSKIEKVLRSVQGTSLEPFELDEENLRVAVFLTRLAFSRKEGQSRIRINSIHNPLDQGGLVLTHNLNFYLIERLSSAKYTRSPKLHWVFNPAREPLKAQLPPRLPAEGWIGEHGYEASVELKDFGVAEWKYPKLEIPSLLRHSYLMESNESLINLGVDAWKSSNRLHIAVVRPELMIRLGPQITSESGLWFVLDQKDEDCDSAKIHLNLQLSIEEKHPLTAQVVLGQTDLGGWLFTGCSFSPQLDEDLLEELQDWGPISVNINRISDKKAA